MSGFACRNRSSWRRRTSPSRPTALPEIVSRAAERLEHAVARQTNVTRHVKATIGRQGFTVNTRIVSSRTNTRQWGGSVRREEVPGQMEEHRRSEAEGIDSVEDAAMPFDQRPEIL